MFNVKKQFGFRRTIASIFAIFSLSVNPTYANAFSLEGTIFEKVGIEANIDPVLLYSIALAESGFNPSSTQWVAPYPWVLRTPSKPIYSKNQKEAIEQLRSILKTSKAVDVGLMQINIRWHGHRIKNVEELLDPLTNLRIGADILNENFARNPENAIKAIGNYHSYEPERAYRYGLTVWRIFSTLKSKTFIP